MNQFQELKKKVRMPQTYAKGKAMFESRKIHKSSVGNVWMVESSKGGFYKVEYLEGEFLCECPAFAYGMTVPCKHIIFVGLKTTGSIQVGL